MSAGLAGRRILVTGASSGIGAATCRAIAAAGGTVAMLARRKERLDGLSEELGAGAIGIPCDMTDVGQIQSAVAAAASALGGLDGLVAAAGQSMLGTITSGDPARWRSLLDLNLIGPLATTRYAVESFPDAGRRDVIWVGSAGGLTPMPGVGIYAASKRGLQAASDALRLELAPHGIAVGLVLPGMFDTEALSTGIVVNGSPTTTPTPPMFCEGAMIPAPSVVADAITFMLGLPEGSAINELIVRPVAQLAP